MTESPNVTVFEAMNLSRKELLIGATTLPMSELIAGFRGAPPSETRGWRFDEGVAYRSLEFGLNAEDAAAFIRRYAATQRGWRIITLERIIGS